MDEPQEVLAEIKALEDKGRSLMAESQQLMNEAMRKRKAWNVLFGDSSHDADNLLCPPSVRTVRKIISAFLNEFGPGWHPYREVYDWASSAGLTEKTYKNFASQSSQLKKYFDIRAGHVAHKGFSNMDQHQ